MGWFLGNQVGISCCVGAEEAQQSFALCELWDVSVSMNWRWHPKSVWAQGVLSGQKILREPLVWCWQNITISMSCVHQRRWEIVP